MEEYVKAEMTVVYFGSSDVITSSIQQGPIDMEPLPITPSTNGF